MSTPPTTTESLSSAEVKDLTTRYTYGTWRRQKGWSPLHIVDAEDCHFVDAAGKRYLDFSAQLMCVTLGHKNRAVIQAIQDQAGKLAFVGPGFATDIRAELAKLLLAPAAFAMRPAKWPTAQGSPRFCPSHHASRRRVPTRLPRDKSRFLHWLRSAMGS